MSEEPEWFQYDKNTQERISRLEKRIEELEVLPKFRLANADDVLKGMIALNVPEDAKVSKD